ncbi:PREDICTED: uncharacterized protein LOC108496229 [Lepidothrix coronata]|uniref:E3 ubiquitin-protein ligase Topors n=1 Tax=Lepidothrix coronata TaxID=321398 RepID=A0A6J0H2H2_9PASS|nr:PREDICTED: uncharacterized protein LOC108496229 [Lepidothrix coronata]
MAMELENRCPICLDICEEPSYVLPCLHQFCYPCIQRWAESKPECPLCKRRILSIVHLVRADDNFEEYVLPSPAAPSVVGHQEGGPSGYPAAQRPAAVAQQYVENQLSRALPGGLEPRTWAVVFRDHPPLLQSLQPGVRQELQMIFGNQHARASILEDIVMSILGLFGLNEEFLVQLLEPFLQTHEATFVQQLIDVAVQQCSVEAQRLLGLEDDHTAEEQEGSPRAAPSPSSSQGQSPTRGPAPSGSPAGADEEEHPCPSISTAALCGGPSSTPSAPIPSNGEQEELHEDLGEAVAVTSTPSWDRDRSPQGPWRALKRKAGSSQESSKLNKTKRRQQP